MLVAVQVIQAVSVILACWAAIAAIGAWKREFIGKRQIELAEDVLAKFYELRDAISMIRNPASYSGEGSSRTKGEYETKEDALFLNRVHLIYERFDKKREAFNEFNMLKYRFLAAFGKEHEQVFIDVNRVLNSIFASAQLLGTYYWKRQGRVKISEEEFAKHLEEMHKHEGIYWEGFNEKDEIKEQLAEILSRLESVVKPCFEPPSGLYERLVRKRFLLRKG